MIARLERGHPSRWVAWSLYVLAALVGLKYGYDFGLSVSGGSLLIGVIGAINGAVFSTIIMDAVAVRLPRKRSSKRR